MSSSYLFRKKWNILDFEIHCHMSIFTLFFYVCVQEVDSEPQRGCWDMPSRCVMWNVIVLKLYKEDHTQEHAVFLMTHDTVCVLCVVYL